MRMTSHSAILLAAAAYLVSGCHHHPPEQQPVAMQMPQGTPMHPHGIPALKVNPSAPQPFTQTDVANYLATHNLPLNAGDPSQFHVASLEFITAKQAQDRLQGEATGLDDIERVGFVTLTGTFTFSGPGNVKPATFTGAYAIFVASTGSLIMDGTLDNQKNNPNNPR
jgi:hypothetical protein